MARKFQIDKVMVNSSEEERNEFKVLCANPGVIFDDLMEWLVEHGYQVSRGAVYNYRANFEEKLKSLGAAKDIAMLYRRGAETGKSGVADLSIATVTRFTQLLMTKLFKMDEDGELESGDLLKLSIAMKSAVSAIEPATKAKEREIAAVKAAQTAAEAGASGTAVVAKVREILGISDGGGT